MSDAELLETLRSISTREDDWGAKVVCLNDLLAAFGFTEEDLWGSEPE